MVRFPPKRRARLSLNMAPLLDVVFLLLLFFMLTSSFSQPVIALKLPEGKTGKLPETRGVVITADRDGAVYVNQRSVSLEGLEEVLRQEMAQTDRKEVHFRGDELIPFKLFVAIMDRARGAGVQTIHVAHRKAPEP